MITSFVRTPHAVIFFLPLLNAILTSAGIAVCQLDICLSYYRSPGVSHPWGSWYLTFLIVSSIFRITIWNRNILVSLIAVGVWLGGLGLNMRSTYRTL